MTQERDESSTGRGFKVVDRRRFTEDGAVRAGVEHRPAAPAVPAAAPAAPVAPAPSAASVVAAAPAVAAPTDEAPAAPVAAAAPKGHPDAHRPEVSAQLRGLLQSLYQQALLQLGVIPWPHTGRAELQIEEARDTLDLITALRIKTDGNLSEEEVTLFETVIYEVRMMYTERTNEMARMMRNAATQGGPAASGLGKLK